MSFLWRRESFLCPFEEGYWEAAFQALPYIGLGKRGGHASHDQRTGGHNAKPKLACKGSRRGTLQDTVFSSDI